MALVNNLNERYLKAKRALFDRSFGMLNDKQREAAFSIDGPLLVLAGAGTGKTTLLVHRIAYILKYGNAYLSDTVPVNITEEDVAELEKAVKETDDKDLGMLLDSFSEKKAKPWNVLAITFTNKAADEMKTRLGALLGEDADDLWCGTFHKMCLRILRANSVRINWPSSFTIYDGDDQKKLMSNCMKQLDIDDKALPIKLVLSKIGRLKDTLVTPEEFDKTVGYDYKMQQISSLYMLYQTRLEESKAMDFDDIIMKTVMLLRNNPDVLEKYQKQFQYVLVDEFQDTNHAQFELASLLSGGHNNLMVVGDDDQSIYKFRGANIENILRFDDKIKGTKIIKLEENYRSTSNILGAANSVIRHNFGRRGKELWTNRREGAKIIVKQVENQIDESRLIASKIFELKLIEKRKFGDFAILYRTNAQSNAIENVLRSSGIPYRIVGGVKFYERKEIKDVLAYLAVINNHEDNLRLRRIINEPKRKIGDATISAVETLAEDEGSAMFYIMEHASEYTALSKSAGKFAAFVDMINKLGEMAKTEPVTETVKAMLEMSGYLDMLSADDEDPELCARRENVEEFVSNAVVFDETHENANLATFLEEISLVTDIDEYDEESDAVVLMTIHTAKGLEFPVVFLPGMEEGLFPSLQSAMNPDELEEERRLAYVAITRAKDRVFMINARERMLYGKTQYNSRSKFIDEIDPQFVIDDAPKSRTPVNNDYGDRRRTRLSDELTTRTSVAGAVGRASSLETLAVGDRVKHMTFGDGTVLSVREMGSDVLYEIAFDTVGTKKLMATYAKLKKI